MRHMRGPFLRQKGSGLLSAWGGREVGRKFRKLLRKYSVPAMWASGGFCLVGVALERLGLPGMTAYRRTVRGPLPPALPTPRGGLRKNGVFVLTFPAEMRTILSIHNRIFCIAVFNCLQTRSTIRRKSL